MANDLSLALRLQADATRFVAGLREGETGVRGFTDKTGNAISRLKQQLAALGVSAAVAATLRSSARLDKDFARLGLAASMSRGEVEQLRDALQRMAGASGQSLDDLRAGANTAIEEGLRFREIVPVMDAANKAMAVTGIGADDVVGSLAELSDAWQFDLAKPGEALALLDKMTVAGEIGEAKFNHLGGILNQVGLNAAAAGMDVNHTLGLIEALSKVEGSPMRVGAMMSRLIDIDQIKTAAEMSSVKLFDPLTKKQRDPLAILRDIKKEYDKLGTDKARAEFLHKGFGAADARTTKALGQVFGGDMLDQVDDFAAKIADAGGALEKKLPEAINNAADQSARLKNLLGAAADDFVRPINEAINKTIQYGLNKKEDGGLGLDGKDLIVGGAATAAGLWGLSKLGGKAVQKLLGGAADTAVGVAEGKALEAAAGVTPVFVVNMPDSLGGAGGLADLAGAGAGAAGGAGRLARTVGGARVLGAMASTLPLSAWGSMGAAGLGTAAAGVTAAGAVGYGAGTLLYKGALEGTSGADKIGESVARVLALFGNEEAKRSLAINEQIKNTEIGGKVNITVSQEGRVTGVSAQSANRNVPLSVDGGLSMVGP